MSKLLRGLAAGYGAKKLGGNPHFCTFCAPGV
jgi:hypothetical protein